MTHKLTEIYPSVIPALSRDQLSVIYVICQRLTHRLKHKPKNSRSRVERGMTGQEIMTHKRSQPIASSVIPRLTRDQLTLLNAVRTRLSQWQDRKLNKLCNSGKTVDPSSRLG